MQRVNRYINQLLSLSVVVMLATMSFLVFLNVVLRYLFNSSFTMTEELSRYLFVWVTFLGAVLAFADNSHVSVTIFIEKLSPHFQRLAYLLIDAITLYCCYLILLGSYQQMVLNLQNFSPISGIPTGVNFLAGVIMSGLIGLLLFARLATRLATIFKGNTK